MGGKNWQRIIPKDNVYLLRFLALYKGLVPKIMRLGPGGAIMLLVYEHVHEYLVKRFPD